MPLPPCFSTHPHKDNWLAVSKLRARTEAANPASSPQGPVLGAAQAIAQYVDEHHDF